MRRIALTFTSLLLAGTVIAGQLTVGDWDFLGLDCFPTDGNTVSLGWTFEAEAGADIEVVSITVWDWGQYDVVYSGGGLLTCTLNNCPENVGVDFVCDMPDDIFNHYFPEVVVDMPTTFCDYDCPELPVIEVPTYSYNFGTVQVGTSLDWELVITNGGNVDLVVDDVVSADAIFTEDFSGPQTIAPQATYTVTVTFTPDDAVVFNGMLTLTSNAEETPLDIDLMGTGAAGPVPDIDVSVTAYSFGNVEVNTEATFDLVISNLGDADLSVTDIVTTPAVFSTDFAGEVIIPPAGSETVMVSFLPVDDVSYNGTLTILNNDQEVVVTLSGLGVEPDIYIPVNSHPFGGVEIGSTAEWTCVVYNVGNADLIISNAVIQLAVFQADIDVPVTIVPNDSLQIPITFTPDFSDTTFNSSLQLHSNDPATPTMVFLSGTAVEGDPPTAFALLTPADNSVVDTAPVTVTWEASTDPDGVDVTYTLYWSLTADFDESEMMAGLVDPSYELTGLSDDTEYFWRVIAQDANSFGTQCNADFSFTLTIPEAPLAFDLMAPPDGQDITLPQNFFWMATTDPDPGDVITYLFQIYDDNGGVVFEGETSNNNINVPDGALVDGTYTWTVLAQDTNTGGTWSNDIWTFHITESVIPGIGIPEVFSISSIYPNPFNPQVNIVYGVPQPANVTATIYNLTGRRVAELNPGFVQPGYHEMAWRPDGATGIYFLRITSDTGWSETRRLIYLK
ncbi:MAG: choice-of-anchor D domain-containing protein [Candidatus Delongbacteria bacterium]|nr:choice-of-anchor D domain-containing protein [Candidatus Delongbacteria bacterium]